MIKSLDDRKMLLGVQVIMVGGAWLAPLIALNYYNSREYPGVFVASLFFFLIPHRYGVSELLSGAGKMEKYLFFYLVPVVFMVGLLLISVFDVVF
jgi:fumarate reductase subunit C